MPSQAEDWEAVATGRGKVEDRVAIGDEMFGSHFGPIFFLFPGTPFQPQSRLSLCCAIFCDQSLGGKRSHVPRRPTDVPLLQGQPCGSLRAYLQLVSSFFYLCRYGMS